MSFQPRCNMAKRRTDGGVSKMDAVRQALAEGKDKPQDGAAYIKEKFGIEIAPQMFSSYKGLLKKKGANGRRRGRRSNAAGSGNPAELARQVKSLVAAYGAAAVSDMLAVFSD